MSVPRKFSLWFGSFVVVASFLYFHFEVPLFPIAIAGALTLVVTVVRYWAGKREVDGSASGGEVKGLN